MSTEPMQADSDPDSESGSPSESHGAMDSPTAQKVYDLLAPVVETAGVELLDVEWTGGTLRIVLDHPDGVTTDSLTTVNRLVSPILDQHDPVPGRYTLEVSSPGVERPLRRLEHFLRAVGENIIVKSIPGVDPRRVKGLLQAADQSEITVEAIEIDGADLRAAETLTIDMTDITSARTVFDWGPTPKPGSGKPGQKGQPKKPHNKDQRQSQRKTKKASGATPGGKPNAKKSGKPQPNRAEQERGRP